MFDYLRGLLVELTPTYAVIECAGVGYIVTISLQTYTMLEGREEAMVYVHHIVREDAEMLYGFAERSERDIFRLLIGVSGVGGGTARVILSTYTPSELANIISSENAVLLKNVKGLGLKTAQKIIVELSGKMIDLGVEGEPLVATTAPDNAVMSETVSALLMLGFQKAASEKVVKAILAESPSVTVEDAVRQALRRL